MLTMAPRSPIHPLTRGRAAVPGLGKTAYRTARRTVVGVVGATLLVGGLALVFLPGPAFVVVGMGLAVLAAEFAWARRWLRKLKRVVANATSGKDEAGSEEEPASQPHGREGL